MLSVSIFIFPDVEVLDFAGPFEVFSVARASGIAPPLFRVSLLAEKPGPVLARGGLEVLPHQSFQSISSGQTDGPNILVIPGGGGYRADGTPFGTRKEVNNPAVISFIQQTAPTCKHVLSVCTGALLLAKAGLLDGITATTHHLAIDALRQMAPHTTVRSDVRFTDHGHILTSGGISAGIDASLHLVGKIHGPAAAQETASYMEYTPALPEK